MSASKMAKLKKVVGWFGLVIGILVSALWGINSDLVNLILPVRTLFPILLVLAAGLLFSKMHPWRMTTAGVFFALGIFIFVSGRIGFGEQTLTFQSHGDTLEGTLYIPEGAGPFPGVVLVHGSLCLPRRLYHPIAAHLAENGIAVFSFDKRGTGNSGGFCETQNNTSLENLNLLSDDIVGALKMVAANPKVDAARLGLWGISQGGWIAPLAAEKDQALAFMVLVSGPSVSTGEENYYSELTGDGHGGSASGLSQSEIEALVEARSPSGFDPYETLLKINPPTLWVYGGRDNSIPVRKSMARLENLKALGKDYTVSLYPTSSHLLIEMRFPFRFSKGFQDEVADWIKSQPGKAP